MWVAADSFAGEIEGERTGVVESCVEQNCRREVRHAEGVLDFEDFAHVLLTEGFVGQVAARTAPQVVLAVVPEVADTTHLQGVRGRVEPDLHVVVLKIPNPIRGTGFLTGPGVGQPGRGPRRDHRPLGVAAGDGIRYPGREMGPWTVLDQDAHCSGFRASASLRPLRNRRAGCGCNARRMTATWSAPKSGRLVAMSMTCTLLSRAT